MSDLRMRARDAMVSTLILRNCGLSIEDVDRLADAAIATVLTEVERHLSAVQYDPAPYTALKRRLSTFLEETGGS